MAALSICAAWRSCGARLAQAGDEWPAILSELVPKRIRAKAAKKPAKKRGEGKDTDGGEWEDAEA